ncbi:hypothetical protein KSP40_PGU022818 [Platanthera guangdongensis]|uniref:Uncharacterized protein n=1 Tax=Platanthera guangdongensis TaxID=2320717 RepID=A0ABR2M156_9ASPA
MEHTREIVEISSDDDENIELRIPEETRGQQGVKKEDDFCRQNNLPAGDSLNVSDDDDCLILEGVSESAATCSEYTELGGELLDEMLIVGEKGQPAIVSLYKHPPTCSRQRALAPFDAGRSSRMPLALRRRRDLVH